MVADPPMHRSQNSPMAPATSAVVAGRTMQFGMLAA
jgi:hypothetical protein